MAIEKIVNIKVSEQGTKEAKQNMSSLNQATNENTQATQTNANTQTNLKTQVRKATIELQNMVNMYGETSAQAVKSAKALAQLKDQMQFATDLTKQFNPDQKLKALGAATQVAGTGLQGVTSGMALFGDQSESTEKALLRVQSAMSFADAIGNLSNVADQWQLLKTTISQSTIVTKANSVATKIASTVQQYFTGTVDNTSKGFKGLKLAIASTGIGLLVIAIGTLISNFDTVKNVVLKFVPSLEKVGEKIMGIVNAVTDFFGITSKAERALSDQKAWAEKAVKQNEKYLKINEHQLTEAQKKENERNNAHFERLASGEYTKEQSLKALKGQAIADQKELDEKAKEKEIERINAQNEKIKQANEKRASQLKEASDKELEILKEKFSEEQLSFEAQRQAVIKDGKLTKEAKANLLKEINKAEKDAIKKNKEEVLAIEQDYKMKLEDLEATTELAKIELEEKRAKEKLARLQGTKEAEIELEKYYAKIKEDLALKKEAEDFEKAIAKKETEAEDEQLSFEDRLALLDEREKLIRLNQQLSFEEGQKLLKENEDKKEAILDKKVESDKQREQKLSDFKENLAQDTLSLIGGLAKSGSKLAKAVAVSQATISTISGINKALAETTDFTPTQTLRFLNAGIVGATGFANVAKILSTPEVGSGGGASGGSAPAPPPPPSFNLVQGTGTNQIAESLARDKQPLKAYVVASEVSTQQSLERNIQSNASV
jgi:hypothetical protein